jgi:16S rRNA processing protein RimM
MLPEQLQIGRILGPHGIRGELRVYPLTDDPTRFDRLKTCLLEGAPGSPPSVCRCVGARNQQGLVLLRLEGVDDRDAAEKLKGRHLLVDRKDAVKLPENAYFICDLVGCRVETLDGEDLGTLEEVLATGSNDVYLVRRPDTRDLLIPALKTVVRSVDIAGRLVRVVLPDGLRD